MKIEMLRPLVVSASAIATLLLAFAACGVSLGETTATITVRTVPTAPPYVSGGDALVRVDAPPETDLTSITVSLNGQDVTPAFRPAPDDWIGRPQNALLGLVSDLRDGDNTVEVIIDDVPVASIAVTNYPITGPIFSGAHLEPYFCLEELERSQPDEPRRFAIGNGEFIEGGAVDDDCSVPTRVDFVYRTTDADGRFLPLRDPANLPAEAALITKSDGEVIPFVVRIETGTINRAIYQTAIVVDPAAPDPDPWSPASGWNGRLVFTFGGGCEAGFFQGTGTGGVLRADMLAAGYAIASSTLNVNSQGGCNDPLSAETAMMVKERFAEVYGPPVHTIGNGGSGGAMQQLLIAGAYPGVIDGILPTSTFPDAVSYLIDSIECLPLRDYLNHQELDDEERNAVGGWATWQTCNESLGGRPNRASPYDCPNVIPAAERYDATAKPDGVRCSIYDGMRSVFGTKLDTEISPLPVVEFGRSPHDNVGVEYGLEALKSGLISKELFLDVNENIGGWDIDFVYRPARTEADPEALRAAYESGRVTSGSGGLATTPIIDERGYVDMTGNFHTSYYSFVMRSRLIRDNGHADNYVLQRRSGGVSLAADNLAAMDRWLTNLALDASGDPIAEKLIRAKPAELVDACWDGEGTRIVEPQSFDESRLFDNSVGRCNTLYPIHAGPRMIAGGPLTNDVLKCQLKPLDRSAYPVTFTDAEWARMQAIFPEGVCDWSKPGVGQVSHTRTWLSFGPSPVNRFVP
jgi:hypothetical protein